MDFRYWANRTRFSFDWWALIRLIISWNFGMNVLVCVPVYSSLMLTINLIRRHQLYLFVFFLGDLRRSHDYLFIEFFFWSILNFPFSLEIARIPVVFEFIDEICFVDFICAINKHRVTWLKCHVLDKNLKRDLIKAQDFSFDAIANSNRLLLSKQYCTFLNIILVYHSC